MKFKIRYSACSIFSLLLAATLNAQIDSATGLTYTIANNEATVTGITDDRLPADGKLVIPETLGGAAVTTIGESAFAGTLQAPNTALLELDAPSVKQIKKTAFYQCVSLASISLPAVNSIGGAAFRSYTALTDLSLPAANSIGGNNAFFGCTQLISVSLPEATGIGFGAFSDCTKLASVHLPKVTTIEAHSFHKCTSLASISLPKVNSVPHNAFFACGKLSSVDLPQATSIGDYAFNNCTSLTALSLPRATSIGDNAFRSCSELTPVSLPRATSIKKQAFAYNRSLKHVYLGDFPALENVDAFTSTHTDLTIHHHPGNDTHFTSGNWGTLKKNEVIRPYLDPVGIVDLSDTVELRIRRARKGGFNDPEDWSYTVERSTNLQTWVDITSTQVSRAAGGDVRIDWHKFNKTTHAAFYRVQASPNFMN